VAVDSSKAKQSNLYVAYGVDFARPLLGGSWESGRSGTAALRLQRPDPGHLAGSLIVLETADKSTISARQTCFCGALRSLISAVGRARSDGETVNNIPLRMRKTRTRRPPREPWVGLLCQAGTTSANF